MVGKAFEVVYDDFSGGHFVGKLGTKAPRNTFQGHEIGACQSDGTLIPLQAPFAVTGTLTGDVAANCSRPIMADAATMVWGGNANLYRAVITGAVPVAVGSAAIGTAIRPNSTPVLFNGEVIYPSAGAGTSIIRQNPNSGALVAVTATNALGTQSLCTWGEFLMVNGGFNVIYFSNPNTAATWTTTDTFDVGDPGVLITDMVVHQGNLFISTSVGMWVATGIPGQTLSLRQITTLSPGQIVSTDASVITTAGPSGSIIGELAGVITRGLNYNSTPDGRPIARIGSLARQGSFVVASDFNNVSTGAFTDEGGGSVTLTNQIWALDFLSGQWVRFATPSAPRSLGVGSGTPGGTGGLGTSAGTHLFYRAGSPDVEQIWFQSLNNYDLRLNDDFTSAVGTAELAEYSHHVPFTIKDVVCEIEHGSRLTSAANGVNPSDRSIAVSVKTPGVAMENETDMGLARSQTSTVTHVFPSRALTGINYTRRRQWCRLNPTDGSDTYVATPVVTLSGVKLRRLVMRCVEAT